MIVTAANGQLFDTTTGQYVGGAPTAPAPLDWTPAGGGQFIGGTPTNVPGGTLQPGAPAPAVYTPPDPAAPPPPPGGNNGGSTYDPSAAWAAALAAQQALQQQQAREAASAFLTNTLKTFGLDSLASQVDSLIQQWGTNTDVIALKIKDTQQYKTRFSGLIGLQQRGITDVANEAQYLQLESSYRQVFRDAGLTSFLGDAGSAAEQAKIADLVGKYSLSVNEVAGRVSDAQRVAANTAPEALTAWQQYYGVGPADLVAYALDPVNTADRINRQANAAVAGGIAAAHALNIGLGVAQQIGDLAGNNDLNAGQLTTDMVGVQQIRDATARLATLEGGSLSDETATLAGLGLDANAELQVSTLQNREKARFGGTGAGSRTTLAHNLGA